MNRIADNGAVNRLQIEIDTSHLTMEQISVMMEELLRVERKFLKLREVDYESSNAGD